ncbi:cytidylyltransferase domain-containing protein [Brevundimonas sp. Root1423]|uniref:acylneuraminate cytidylyltransferase family protein n=1 Tax=Brevundimonas sp. Root1423 TaxID=1736462 RepID=UPI0006F88E88|nr:acylneuraminate cytidylyltransferase family protein [Brevundimonas sp. Root1423]KQY84865.1 acylneuraminate cytidylyltransferase [Brevundimonas sp. Root1423]
MIGGRSVLAVITARGGSKGLPRKNLAPFRGAPLIAWTIRAAQGAPGIDRLILSSDDPEIIDTARSLGCEAPFQRAAELAGDTAASIDVLLDAADRVPGYDVVVLLQPTSPLRTAADIEATLAAMAESGAPGAVSVSEAPCHPYLIFQRDAAGRLNPFVEKPADMGWRRQDLPPAYRINGAVYAADLAWLRAERTLCKAGETAAYEMPVERSIDIDTLEDLLAAERAAD